MDKYDSIEAAVSAAFGEGIRITKKSITAAAISTGRNVSEGIFFVKDVSYLY